VVSDPPRPRLVISRRSLTPWNPATITMLSCSRACSSRNGVILMMRALVWLSVVMMPLCEPVNDTAG
jgi:hypothetical protein